MYSHHRTLCCLQLRLLRPRHRPMPVSRPPGTLDTREDCFGWLCVREPLPRVCALISPWCPPRLHTWQQLRILLPINAERIITVGTRADMVIEIFAKGTFTKLHFKTGSIALDLGVVSFTANYKSSPPGAKEHEWRTTIFLRRGLYSGLV